MRSTLALLSICLLLFPIPSNAQLRGGTKPVEFSAWKPYVGASMPESGDSTWSLGQVIRLGVLSPTRFLGVDRLSTKYPSFSPYCYGANNPVYFIDPSGDSIDVSMARNQNAAALSCIMTDSEQKTGLTLSIVNGREVYARDKDGNPIIALDANGNQVGSAEARNMLIAAIDAKDVASFSFLSSNVGSRAEVGGLQFALNPTQVEAFISGTSPSLNPTTMGWGMSFLHELSHTRVGGGLSDGPKTWGTPGPVEDRLNVVRSQLGPDYGQRMSYPAMNVGGTSYMPMGPVSYQFLSNGRTIEAYTVKYVQTWR